jgi:two-component system, sensor histidine kinase and response regulator
MNDLKTQIPELFLKKWQDTINVMASMFDVPAGLMMRVLPEQIEVLLASETQGNPYEHSEKANLNTSLYCETVMASNQLLHVPNALEDEQWKNNPDVALNMISYLGVPLLWNEYEVFGTICVLDNKTRQYQKKYHDLLWEIKKSIEADFKIIQQQEKLTAFNKELTISNQQLFLAKQAADAANRSKSDFLANMSHEIRTPMNAIIGMSYLVLKTELSTQQINYIKKIQGSGQHLLGIINDILDFSKIEAGKLTVEAIEFELEKVLDNVANQISEKAASKGLELIFNIDPKVPLHLFGDPLRLGQILINYASNAVKFTSQGEVEISIRLQKEVGQSVQIYCAVEDSGIGLTEKQISHLFQSFSQADTSTTRQFGGTGLGLAISKKLVELMGGQIGVESELGRGSCFWFTATLERSTAETSRPVLSSLQSKRVLVVDDHPRARLVLVQLLENLHLSVDHLASGAAALDAILLAQQQKKPYDAIFLDWEMPEMSGIETAIKIKAQALQTMPALILLSACGYEEIIKGSETAVMSHTLSKPITTSLLLDCLESVFGNPSDSLGINSLRNNAIPQLAQIQGARILLVEDNPINQEVANELLQSEGFIVDIAENGQSALLQLQIIHYDIVLMDMQMPIMDGLMATKEIRKLECFQNLPIVAMTANAILGDRERCIAAGMNDHIAKPIDPDELWQALIKWINPEQILAPCAISRRQNAYSEETPIPSDIDGLNINLGLKQVFAKKKLYLTVLDKFISEQENTLSEILKALENKDWPTAERLAHTLKSVAGLIGANSIQQQAEQLESALRQGHKQQKIIPLLNDLKKPLNHLIFQLKQKLPQVPSELSAHIDPNKLAEITQQLLALLDDGDSEAINVLENNASLLNTAFPQQFRMINECIQAFDFDGAQEVLKLAIGNTD